MGFGQRLGKGILWLDFAPAWQTGTTKKGIWM
jgi:hypothetical protein